MTRPTLAVHRNPVLITRTTAQRLFADTSGRSVTGVAVTDDYAPSRGLNAAALASTARAIDWLCLRRCDSSAALIQLGNALGGLSRSGLVLGAVGACGRRSCCSGEVPI